MVSQKQVVFITGASSGLGYGLVQCYVRDGHDVLAFARRREQLEQLVLSCEDFPGRVHLFVGDVCCESDLKKAVSYGLSVFGRLDCVIANAGVGFSTPGYAFDATLFHQTIDVNLNGVARTYAAVLPYFLTEKSGHFVTISSLASYRGLPCSGAYSASKAGVSAFTESMRLDLKPYGIAVSLICPGYIQTPLTDRNDYSMPFLLDCEAGVRRIYKAIRCRKALMAFPFLSAMAVRFLRFLPVCIMDFFLSGRRLLKRGSS